MRVALVSLNARAGDAIGRQLAEKSAALTNQGATVDVIVLDDRNLHPALRPYTTVWQPGLSSKAWQTLARTDCIIIEFSQFHPLLEWLPLLANGKRRIILDYHGLTPPQLANHSQRRDMLRGQEWLGLTQFCDMIVAHSQFAREELQEHVDLPTDVVQIGYPVTIRGQAPDESRLRKALGLKNARVLLFVGRAAPNKRLPVLIKALAEFNGENPAVHAVIVGPSCDEYETEKLRCQELAADLGVSERVHWLGTVDEVMLADCYRSADALVIPSLHEGFCFPIVEAMIHELPVVAARSSALPETIGDAGLTFEPDDPIDLARQLRRLFADERVSALNSTPRIAIVTSSFGETIGGAERSLTLMARQLAAAGARIEVFTMQVHGAIEDQFPVRLCEAAAMDADRSRQVVSALSDKPMGLSTEQESGYWQNTLRCPELINALKQQRYDSIIVGPYLNGLTRDIVRAFGHQSVLVPCLHDEAIARLPGVRKMFQQTGGVLYHSVAERELAHTVLNLSHPNNAVIGTVIDSSRRGHAVRGQKLAESSQYFLYCGRLIKEKNVPKLIDQARRFANSRPGCRFVFIGEGNVAIPDEPWAVNLGRVTDEVKRDLLAGATALVTLSENESLSLIVLEALAQSTPAFVPEKCQAMAAHVIESGAGLLLRNDSDLNRCLDRLMDHPQLVDELGRRGQKYVQREFADSNSFVDRIQQVLQRSTRPIREALIENGRRRSSQFTRDVWRRQFANLLDRSECSASDLRDPVIEIASANDEDTVSMGQPFSVRLTHLGGRPLIPTGPNRTELVVRVRSIEREDVVAETAIPLAQWLNVGHTMVVTVATELETGEYILEAGLKTHGIQGEVEVTSIHWHGPITTLQLTEPEECTPVYRQPVALARPLTQVRALAELSGEFVDVTTGWGARFKRWIKSKILHNFRVGYVDVMAQQQSRFNQRVVEILERLAESSQSTRAASDSVPPDAEQVMSRGYQTHETLKSKRKRSKNLESACDAS